jgi:hypothetical protein
MTEEQKAERKTLIANNRDMESATKVRREFVKTLLSRKAAPKGHPRRPVPAVLPAVGYGHPSHTGGAHAHGRTHD